MLKQIAANYTEWKKVEFKDSGYTSVGQRKTSETPDALPLSQGEGLYAGA